MDGQDRSGIAEVRPAIRRITPLDPTEPEACTTALFRLPSRFVAMSSPV